MLTTPARHPDRKLPPARGRRQGRTATPAADAPPRSAVEAADRSGQSPELLLLEDASETEQAATARAPLLAPRPTQDGRTRASTRSPRSAAQAGMTPNLDLLGELPCPGRGAPTPGRASERTQRERRRRTSPRGRARLRPSATGRPQAAARQRRARRGRPREHRPHRTAGTSRARPTGGHAPANPPSTTTAQQGCQREGPALDGTATPPEARRRRPARPCRTPSSGRPVHRDRRAEPSRKLPGEDRGAPPAATRASATAARRGAWPAQSSPGPTGGLRAAASLLAAAHARRHDRRQKRRHQETSAAAPSGTGRATTAGRRRSAARPPRRAG